MSPQLDQYSQTKPSGSHVHVWTLDHDHAPTPEHLTRSKILSAEEQQRLQRFATPELRHRFQCRREMIRQTLTLYQPDIKPADWHFNHNEYGKPEIHPSLKVKDLHFNLSHTEGLTVLMITDQQCSGIDIENTAVKQPRSFLDIADRFFTDLESRDIAKGSNEEQIQRFFDYWTLKEAYIKADGQGLSLGLDRFEFLLEVERPISIHFIPPTNEDANNWVFHQCSLETFRLAIAIKKENAQHISCEFLDYSVLT